MESHHLGVTRNALRENRLVIFGLCSIGLRRHGPFISCHIFLPLCFALSGTHLGSSFFRGSHGGTQSQSDGKVLYARRKRLQVEGVSSRRREFAQKVLQNILLECVFFGGYRFKSQPKSTW